jgi:hypothetical protein
LDCGEEFYSQAAGDGLLFYGLLEAGWNGLKYHRPINMMKNWNLSGQNGIPTKTDEKL